MLAGHDFRFLKSLLLLIVDMHAIDGTIFELLHNCENVKYVISHSDVINAVSHYKNGKSDCSEDLFSDNFLHATHRFYVILSILYTLFLSHGFSPDSMIPIPKNRKQSLCNSSNSLLYKTGIEK